MRQLHSFSFFGVAFLLAVLTTALPDGNSDMDMNMVKPAEDGPHSYFALGEHSVFILAHIILEVISWCFILPLGKVRAHRLYQIPS